MPFKLLLMVLGTVIVMTLSGYELWHGKAVGKNHPLELINLGVGFLLLLGVALGREWLRPVGLTLAGVLLVQSVFVFFGVLAADGMNTNLGHAYATTFHVSVYTLKFVLGSGLLWCMRQRDTIAWIFRREAHRDI